MPSGSSAALALAAAPAPLPQPPPPPPPLPPPPPPPAGGPELEGDGLLLRERLAALGLDDPSPAEPGAPAIRAAAAQGPARRAAGPSPEERAPPGRPGVSEAAELELEEDDDDDEEEEGEDAELDGDLLEEEELEEAEEEGRPSLLLLSPPAAAASQTQPIPGGSLGSVLLPAAGFDAREAAAAAAAAGVLYGGDDAQGMMAAMLSHAYGPGGCGAAAAAAALNGEQAALLRRKSVNTTECVPVPSSEHVAEIVGRQGECEWGVGGGVSSRAGPRAWVGRRKKGAWGCKGEPGEAPRSTGKGCGRNPRGCQTRRWVTLRTPRPQRCPSPPARYKAISFSSHPARRCPLDSGCIPGTLRLAWHQKQPEVVKGRVGCGFGVVHEKLRDRKFAQPTTVFVKSSQPALRRLSGKKKLTEMEAWRGDEAHSRGKRGCSSGRSYRHPPSTPSLFRNLAF